MANEEPLFDKLPQQLAYFSFVLTSEEDRELSQRNDNHLYGFALEAEGHLYSIIQRRVRETLGEDYRIEDFSLEPGSLILSFVLAADTFLKSPPGQLILNFSRYEALMKSISLLLSQLSSLLHNFFGRKARGVGVQVNGSWHPSAALMAAMMPQRKSASSLDANLSLLAYLMISHALLLGALLWLVVHHLR